MSKVKVNVLSKPRAGSVSRLEISSNFAPNHTKKMRQKQCSGGRGKNKKPDLKFSSLVWKSLQIQRGLAK
jgi:hypothetical protein